MKKLLSTMMVIVLTLSGCGASSGDDGEPKEIRYTWWGSNDRNNATLEMVDLYNSSQDDYVVVPEYFDYDSYETRLTTQMASDSAACVVQTDFMWYQNYDPTDWVDLSQYADELQLDQYNEGLLDSVTTDGMLLGLPIASNGSIFTWNQTLLDEAGIEKPETWADIMADSEKLTDALGTDTWISAVPDYISGYLMENYIYQMTGNLPLDESGKWQWTEEELQMGLEAYQQLLEVATPGTDLVSGDQTDSTPYDGVVAGGIAWLGAIDGQEWRTADDELTYTIWPSAEGQVTNGALQKPSMSYSIPSTCENVDGAVEFISFITSDIDALTLQGTTRGLVANQAAAQELLGNGVIEETNVVKATQEMNSWEPAALQPMSADLENAFEDAKDALRYGTDTPENLAKSLNEMGASIYQ